MCFFTEELISNYRIGKHVGEFESMFLADLEGGNLPCIDSYGGLEGDFLCYTLKLRSGENH